MKVKIPAGGAQVQCPACQQLLQIPAPSQPIAPARPAAQPAPQPPARQATADPFANVPSQSSFGNLPPTPAPNPYAQKPTRPMTPPPRRSPAPVIAAVAGSAVVGLLAIGAIIYFATRPGAKEPTGVAQATDDAPATAATPSTTTRPGTNQNQATTASVKPTTVPTATPSSNADAIPLSEAEALAKRFERLLALPSDSPAEAMIAYDELVEKAGAGFELSPVQKNQFKTGLLKGLRSSRFVRSVKSDAESIKLLRMRNNGSQPTALFRVSQRSGGISYFELGFGRKYRQVVINDLYMYSTAEWVSETVRKRALPMVAQLNKSFLQRITSTNENLYVKHGPDLLRLTQQGQSRPAWALQEIKRLPKALQNDKSLLVLRIHAASQSDNDQEYMAAMEAMRNAYPNDPAQKLFEVDYWFMKNQIDKAGQAIRDLDTMVGGDPALATLEAAMYIQSGNQAKAKTAIQRALQQDPGYEEAHALASQLGIPTPNSNASSPANPNPNSRSPFESVAPRTPGLGGSGGVDLTAARANFKTTLVRREKNGSPVPEPPRHRAKKVRYQSDAGMLEAYLTNLPPGRGPHPAIIWISGGDCNTIDDGFFESKSPDNDQTASAFWRSGVMTMYPSLRGGNTSPGYQEYFYGEVDDVIAARDFLAKQPGVDPNRIYLGGHSTGGTLVLLVAASTDRFRAVFSFGPAEEIRGYGDESIVFDATNAEEFRLRDPIHWIGSAKCQTFIIEGLQQPSNFQSLMKLKFKGKRGVVECFPAPRYDHFSVLAPVTQQIATRIKEDDGQGRFQVTRQQLGL